MNKKLSSKKHKPQSETKKFNVTIKGCVSKDTKGTSGSKIILPATMKSEDKKKAKKVLEEIGEGKVKLNYLGSSQGFVGNSDMFIYCVASMQKKGENPRTWGWYPTEKEAREAVAANAADMFEFYYSYTVIEKVHCGIPAAMFGIDTVSWFKWNSDKTDPQGWRGKWKACKPPEFSKSVIGWTLG